MRKALALLFTILALLALGAGVTIARGRGGDWPEGITFEPLWAPEPRGGA